MKWSIGIGLEIILATLINPTRPEYGEGNLTFGLNIFYSEEMVLTFVHEVRICIDFWGLDEEDIMCQCVKRRINLPSVSV